MGDWMNEVTTLVRSGRGSDTIHVRGCSKVGKKVLPWTWAEGMDHEQIARTAENGLRFCKVCDPVETVRRSRDGGSDG